VLRLQYSVEIGRPRDEVWRRTVDPELIPAWMNGVVRYGADWAGREPQAGDSVVVVRRALGRRVCLMTKVTAVVPGASIDSETVDAPVPVRQRWTFTDTGAGTEVTMRDETPGRGGVAGMLTNPVLALVHRRNLRSRLDNLKALLEH
jgi:uncharacterized protein YndB with AHSA1/START domain